MEWVREVVATTLGVAPLGQLPPIIMQQEVPSIWDQIRKLPAVLVSHTVCCQFVLWRELECNEGPQNGSFLRLIDCASHQSLASVQLITFALKKRQEGVLHLLRVASEPAMSWKDVLCLQNAMRPGMFTAAEIRRGSLGLL